jgi:hypothetical protein
MNFSVWTPTAHGMINVLAPAFDEPISTIQTAPIFGSIKRPKFRGIAGTTPWRTPPYTEIGGRPTIRAFRAHWQ